MLDAEVEDLLYSQALIFKLMLLPPVFYELAYNLKNKASIGDCVTAISLSLIVALVMSFLYYLSDFVIDMPYTECLILALSLSTVDTDHNTQPQARTMSLAVNVVILLLIQYLSISSQGS